MFLHWKRNRTMNNTKLKKAMILGTIALIWTIPSVNLFGVIAVIVSWIAYSNSKKNMAYVSTGMYIAATVISILFAIVLLFAGGMFSFVGETAGVSHNAMTNLLNGMAAFSLVGEDCTLRLPFQATRAEKQLKNRILRTMDFLNRS